MGHYDDDRVCQDCGTPIGERFGSARFCVPCANVHSRVYYKRWYDRKKATKELAMTFVTMQIKVSLSDDMEAALPKSGDAEMHAIDVHSNSIDRIVDSHLHEIASDLTSAGYIVVVDESV